MKTVYRDKDLNAVCIQKKKILSVFWAVFGAYLLFCLAWLIYYISLPYEDPMQALPKACVYVASGLFVAFAFPFMGIKYSRVRKYYKMMYFLSEGLKNTEQNYFVGFEKRDVQKDYVDVVSVIFKTWNAKKSEWMIREAYIDKEKPLPDFELGDLVKYVTQGNFILQYKIVKKAALTPEEARLDNVYFADEIFEEEKEEASDEECADANADESIDETVEE